MFWVWINLLPFAIANQRKPAAVLEDSVNKPWRPMPSKRIQPEKAKIWMFCLYPAAVVASLQLGGIRQCVALIFLGTWYNDLNGADVHFLVRNFINACGFVSYASGAMEVALGREVSSSPKTYPWLLVIGLIVFFSVHSQDMPDQVGDRLRNRNTVPLAIGDGLSRWTIAASVSVFSLYCPLFWGCSSWAYVGPMLVGGTVCLRTLTRRSVYDDQITFRIWNLWMVILYCLPLVKSLE